MEKNQEKNMKKIWLKKIKQKIVKILKSFISLVLKKWNVKWQIESDFDPSWKLRIKNMSKYIEPNESILDLGCGLGWLKEFIFDTNIYFSSDLYSRDDQTIVCDLNKYQYPEIEKVDVVFISGVLEYINDWQWFFDKICSMCNKIILSYCTQELFPDIIYRKQLFWVNSLTLSEITNTLQDRGFAINYFEEDSEIGIIIVAQRRV